MKFKALYLGWFLRQPLVPQKSHWCCQTLHQGGRSWTLYVIFHSCYMLFSLNLFIPPALKISSWLITSPFLETLQPHLLEEIKKFLLENKRPFQNLAPEFRNGNILLEIDLKVRITRRAAPPWPHGPCPASPASPRCSCCPPARTCRTSGRGSGLGEILASPTNDAKMQGSCC